MPTMNSLLTVSEAAVLLGVSTSTIRNWDRTGKLKAIRHPINNYRLYERQQLQAVLDCLTRDSSLWERSKQ
jgi:excisionase family DNA binding protein